MIRRTKPILLEVMKVNPSWDVQKMIKVGTNRRVYDEKYQRFYYRRSAFMAHYTSKKTPVVGEKVWVTPCRPLSASKRHIAWPRKQ